MAISKRLRFKVLRRDNHTCLYCGRSAPEVSLAVDHVTPVALGGRDEPANLATSCTDCNNGKGSAAPDGPLIQDVNEDATRWAAARQRAQERIQQEAAHRERQAQPFLDDWLHWDEDGSCLPDGWESSISAWVAQGISIDRILNAHHIAIGMSYIKSENVFAYMAGIIRNWLVELDEMTYEELAGE